MPYRPGTPTLADAHAGSFLHRLVAYLAFLNLLCFAAPASAQTTVSWISDADGSWDVGSNWSTATVPAAGDTVIISRPTANPVITISTTTAAVQSLTVDEQLVISGNLVVATSASLNGGLTLTGTLSGNGAITVGGAMTWTSGTISGAGGVEVAAGQTLTITTGNNHFVSDGTLRTRGPVTWTGAGVIYMGGTTASIVNEATGVWDVPGNRVLSYQTTLSKTFSNAGTLRKSGGTGTMYVYVGLVNTGTTEVQSGTLSLEGTTTSSGALVVGNGTTLTLTGTTTLASGATVTGGGTLAINGTTTVTNGLSQTMPLVVNGTLVYGGTGTFTGGVTLAGTISGSGAMTVDSALTWSGGTIGLAGGLEVAAGQTLTITTGNNHCSAGL